MILLIDILFNNAGVSQFGYFEESDLSVLDKIMELDFFSVVQFTKSILPHMVDKKSGQIVTNTSVAGLVGSRNRSFYSSAKFALHGFFDSLRSEIIHHNVHFTLGGPYFYDYVNCDYSKEWFNVYTETTKINL